MVFNVGQFGPETFSGVIEDEFSETHGSVFCMDDENKRNMDNAERLYKQKNVSVTTHIVRGLILYTTDNITSPFLHQR